MGFDMPASGLMGPGQYTFSERLIRRAVVWPKFLKSDRFRSLVRDDAPLQSPSASSGRHARAEGNGLQDASGAASSADALHDRTLTANRRRVLPQCHPGL